VQDLGDEDVAISILEIFQNGHYRSPYGEGLNFCMGYIVGLEFLLAVNNLVKVRFFVRYGFKLDRSKDFFKS